MMSKSKPPGLPSTHVRKGFSRFVGRWTPSIKNAGVSIGVGVGLEAGLLAYERHKKNKERAMRRYEKDEARFQQQHPTNEAVEFEQPPAVLILKRKTVRLYPDGQRIALYRNARLGLNFAVPYENSNDGHKAVETLGAVSEATSGFWRRQGKLFMQGLRMMGRRGERVDHETWTRRQEKVRRDAARKKKASQEYQKRAPEQKKAGKSAKKEIGAAIASGYLTSKAIDKMRHEVERPNKKRHGGSYVYESGGPQKGAFVKVPAHLRLGGLAGIAVGSAGVAYGVAKEISTAEKEAHKRKRRAAKKVVVQEMARRPGSKLPKVKSTLKFAPKGYKRAVLKTTMKKLPWKGALAGAAIGGALYSRHKTNKQVATTQAKFEEKEHIQEFLPAVAAALGRVTIGGVARFVAGQAATGYAIDKVMKAGETATDKVAKSQAKKQITQRVLGQTPSHARPNPAKVVQDSSAVDESLKTSLDEAARKVKKKKPKSKMKKAEVKLKKTMVPTGLGKDVTRGVAIALGTAAATKLIDVWYDRHRDKKEVEKAAAEARAKAKAQHEVAPRKVTEKKKINPKTGVVTVNKKIVEHIDGTSTTIEGDAVVAIESLFEQLNDDNKAMMLNMMSESPQGLEKISAFAMKQYLEG